MPADLAAALPTSLFSDSTSWPDCTSSEKPLLLCLTLYTNRHTHTARLPMQQRLQHCNSSLPSLSNSWRHQQAHTGSNPIQTTKTIFGQRNISSITLPILHLIINNFLVDAAVLPAQLSGTSRLLAVESDHVPCSH